MYVRVPRLQGQSVSPVLLHEAAAGGRKGQQLMLVGLGKPQATPSWGETGFHVSTPTASSGTKCLVPSPHYVCAFAFVVHCELCG